MKKSLLFVLAFAGAAGMSAQQVHLVPLAHPVAATKFQKPTDVQFSQAYAQPNTSVQRSTPPSTTSTTVATVGQTIYPLQTNASDYPRIVYNSDGTISCAWTYSAGSWNAWTDRGTGYNYWDGSTWGAFPSARLENDRTGFTNIGVTGTGGEITCAHNTTQMLQHFMTRPAKGTGTWTNSTSLISPPSGWTYGTWWPRMAVGGASGDVIHHIAISAPSGLASGGGPYTNGQDGCILYARSNDGGATFAVQNQVLAPFDQTQETGYNGDDYAIDANGNTVAIVAGGIGRDIVLAKSTDGGVTWTKTVVLDFPIPLWNDMLTDTNSDGIADTLETNDGSLAVLVDNNGLVHVAWGDMRMYDDTPGDGQYSYFPGTNGLFYWNENMPVGTSTLIGAALDLNGNGMLDLPPAPSFGTYQVSLSSHATFGVDASNNIFVAYDAIVEGTDDQTSRAFRNIYVVASSDAGMTWTAPYNVNPDPTNEQVYPSIARHVASDMVIEYQQDPLAGHGVSTTGVDPDNVGVTADIIVARVPVSDVIAGVHENNAPISNIALYPNPSNGSANLDINSKVVGDVMITMYNNLGQAILNRQDRVVMGGNVIPLNVDNLASGIYTVTVTQGSSMVSSKLIVQ